MSADKRRRGDLSAFRLGLAAALLVAVAPACASGLPRAGGPGAGAAIDVVAAENFWGSIAAQVGGSRVRVTSIVTRPGADPHGYEPTPADARAIAAARLVIENGIGYDPWVGRLLAADGGHRVVIDVGRVVGARPDSNPHRWYDPTAVEAVVRAYVAGLTRLDPADGAWFHEQAARFEAVGLAMYHSLIEEIRGRYRGVPVGASESIFAMLAPALGLNLVTPTSFLRDISEGSEVSAADKSTIDRQIADHSIAIYVYNSQNTTPDIRTQLAECRAAGIPTTVITETLAPASASFQAWQTAQLRGILAALSRSAPRPASAPSPAAVPSRGTPSPGVRV